MEPWGYGMILVTDKLLFYSIANVMPLKLWDLLEGKKLFKVANPKSKDDEYDDQTHLAYISALLGPPPRELLTSGRRASMFYKSDGTYIPHAFTNVADAYN